MARGLTIGPIVTAGVFVLLGLASIVTLVPGIMLFDAPGADRMPLTLAAGISSMLAPPAFFVGAAALLLAGHFRRCRLVRIATIVPLLVLATMVLSLTLLFTWCAGGVDRIGCRPL